MDFGGITNLKLYKNYPMKYLITSCFLLLILVGNAQDYQKPEDYGCFLIPFEFEGDTVNILIRPNLEDYNKKKPLLLFIQGSMPQPLLKYNERGRLNTFPFDENIFVKDYHCLLYTSPSPRDATLSRMPSSA